MERVGELCHLNLNFDVFSCAGVGGRCGKKIDTTKPEDSTSVTFFIPSLIYHYLGYFVCPSLPRGEELDWNVS